MAEEKRDSYTKLFNPILEALCKSNLNGSELKIVFYVIRCTYGWNKKKFAMSKSFIAEGTGIDRRNVGKIIKSLVERNVLIDYGVENGSRTKIYGLNKHFSQWVMCGELTNGKSADICASNSALDSGNSADDMCGESAAQNRHIKRHIKKEKEKKCSQNSLFFNTETETWEERDEPGEEE